MAKRKRNKRDMSAGRIAMIAIVVGLLIGIALVAKNIITLSLEKRALLQQNSELTDKRDELAAELENVNDLDYIEEQARKLLHMIRFFIFLTEGIQRTRTETSISNFRLSQM